MCWGIVSDTSTKRSAKGVVMALYGTRSSILKIELIPKSVGKSKTYTLEPILLKFLNGPKLRACSFLAESLRPQFHHNIVTLLKFLIHSMRIN